MLDEVWFCNVRLIARIMFRDSLSVWRAEEQRLAVSQARADGISV
jgi:hypothetical protein